MVTTFVNHLYFEGRLVCSVDGFYFLSCIHLFNKNFCSLGRPWTTANYDDSVYSVLGRNSERDARK